jgi:hypothetical protein
MSKENIVLSETSQGQKDKYCVLSLTCESCELISHKERIEGRVGGRKDGERMVNW